MELPGIQALFGFQLVAVFDGRFEILSPVEQRIHLVAILCVVLAVALVMAPAALHRFREPRLISARFLEVSSRLLMFGMAPLAVGTTLDVYLVARVVTHSTALAGVASAVSLVAFAFFWAIFPQTAKLDR